MLTMVTLYVNIGYIQMEALMNSLQPKLLALLAAVFALQSVPALAEDDPNCDEVCRIKEHVKRSLFIFSPRYFPLAHNGHHAPFTSNGFTAPASSLPSFHFTFGKHMDSGFDLGLAIGKGYQSAENGVYEASYEFMYAGLYAGYDLLPESNTDLTVGSTLGYSWSTLDVLSATQNGRVNEGAMVWEPSIAIAQKITNNFRLGIVASYILPFGNSRDFKGQDLGAQGIAPRGANIGLQLIFGRFGAEEEPKK